MEEMEKVVEITEEAKGRKKKKRLKSALMAGVSLIIVAILAVGGYLYAKNEKRYEDYVETARKYVTKVEKACDNLKIVNAVQTANFYEIFSGKGESEAIEETMGWNTPEAKEVISIQRETNKLATKLRNEKNIYFHKDIEEIRKVVKVLNEDFSKCSSIYKMGNAYNILTSYSDNIENVKSGIRKLKNLIY